MHRAQSSVQHEPPALRTIGRAIEILVDGAIAISAIGVIVSLVLVAFSVMMRYLVNQPQVWVDDAVGFLLVAIVMLAAAQVLRRGEHIGVDMITERLSPGAARWAHIWSALSSGAVAVALVFYGFRTAMQSREFGVVTEGQLEWPVWWLMMLLPLGGVLLTLVSIESLWRLALKLPDCAARVHHAVDVE